MQRAAQASTSQSSEHHGRPREFLRAQPAWALALAAVSLLVAALAALSGCTSHSDSTPPSSALQAPAPLLPSCSTSTARGSPPGWRCSRRASGASTSACSLQRRRGEGVLRRRCAHTPLRALRSLHRRRARRFLPLGARKAPRAPSPHRECATPLLPASISAATAQAAGKRRVEGRRQEGQWAATAEDGPGSWLAPRTRA